MSRDDYISKLFIENQDKLNKAPSSNLWDRIEAEMDKTAPVSPSQSPVKVISLTKYLAAASVLVVISVGVWMFAQSEQKDNRSSSPIAMNEQKQLSLPPKTEKLAEEVILESSEALPINEKEVKAKQAVEDKVQEQRILKIAQNTKPDEIKIADKIEKIALQDIVLETEPSGGYSLTEDKYQNDIAEEETPLAEKEEIAETTTKITTEIPVTTRNYAAPPALNSTSNQILAEEIVRNAPQQSADVPTVSQTSTRSNRVQSRKKAKKKAQTIYISPMANAHPRLKIFGWMLGKWVDDNEENGTSYEKWQLKDANTLQGKGYKLSAQNERVFEEIMEISYRPDLNQVFLTLSLKESQEKLQYMLSSFDNERIVFLQNSSNQYPDEVILQRDLDGFTMIMVNNKGFLSGDQQRYLENRNRVSNVRAIRTMRYEE